MKKKEKTIRSIDDLNKTYFPREKCPYLGKCRSEGFACMTCKNNPNNKKEDHYEKLKINPYEIYLKR